MAADALAGVRAAFMVLTRLPMGRDTAAGARRWASAWFPLVGAVVGGAVALAAAGLAPYLGPWLAAVVAVAVGVSLTGGLHEDGLGDTADALGGARTREQIFVILKDPRHGTHAVLAIGLALLFRVGAIAALAPLAPLAIVLAAILARAAMVGLLAALPYVTPAGQSRSADVAHAGPAQLGLALAATAAAASLLVSAGLVAASGAIAASFVAALVTAACGWRFHVRAGGITGDFLGAAEQVAGLAALGALVAAQR